MPASDAITVIDWYRNSKGKSIMRIDAQRKDFLRELANMFDALGSGRTEHFRIVSSPHVLLSKRIRGVVLTRMPTQRVGELSAKHADSNSVEISWQCPPHAWQRYLELLHGVIDSPVPSHQYFGNDAEVEIALGEWRPKLEEFV